MPDLAKRLRAAERDRADLIARADVAVRFRPGSPAARRTWRSGCAERDSDRSPIRRNRDPWRDPPLTTQTFAIDEAITYQELDSIDNPNLYTEDDVVEVFIRANSGGTRLRKSDLLFSLLTSSWEVATDRMEDLLDSLEQEE
jgi:hypothetical protein